MTLYTLRSEALEVQISDLGARLITVLHQGLDLIYGPKTKEAIEADQCYCGAICGRVANRIAGGKCRIAGTDYQLPLNNGGNHLHGGISGFSDKIWEVEKLSETSITLSYTSPDGEEGYPGRLKVSATYSLEGAKLNLELRAQSDQDSLVNLTNHAYWNLDGQGDITQHKVQIVAESYTPMQENIPTGEIASVEASCFDLREGRVLGELIGEGKELALGFDDNYCLGGNGYAALLQSNGHQLRIETDAPGMQVYTGYYLPDIFGGIALEAQGYPDAVNHSNFPSIELKAGKIAQRHISWEISEA